MSKRVEPPRPTKFNRPTEVMQAVKGRGRPLGGAPEVKIPPLDAEPMAGPDGRPMSMHQQAEMLRDKSNPLSPYYDPQPSAVPVDKMNPHQLRQRRGPMPGPFGGVLPPEAQQDPRFRHGVGSMYAANQPGIQNAPDGGAALSNKTVEGLEALAKFQQDAEKAQQKVADEAAKKDEASSLDNDLELLDQPSFLNQYQKEVNELNTEELRRAIEARCAPLNIEQLIMDGELRQDVPIIREKFIATFRTVTGEENLAIEREIFSDRNVSDIYVLDKMSLMQLTCGLYAVNGRMLPSHLDDSRRFNGESFKKKFRMVTAFPLCQLASLGINFTWFDQRTRRLFIDVDQLKNG